MTGRKGSTATSKLTFPSAWRLVQPSLRKYRSLTNRLKKGITTCRHTTVRIMPCEKEPLWLKFSSPHNLSGSDTLVTTPCHSSSVRNWTLFFLKILSADISFFLSRHPLTQGWFETIQLEVWVGETACTESMRVHAPVCFCALLDYKSFRQSCKFCFFARLFVIYVRYPHFPLNELKKERVLDYQLMWSSKLVLQTPTLSRSLEAHWARHMAAFRQDL